MPALPPVPGVVRTIFKWTDEADNNVLTRMYWSHTASSLTSAQLHTWLVSLVTAWEADMQPLYANTITINTVTAEDLSSSSGASGESTWSITGTRAGTQNPIQVCVAIQYVISRRYRGGKPKGFWPLGVENDVSGGRLWTTGAQSAFLTGLDNFAASVLGSTIGSGSISQQVNVSYYQGFISAQNPVTHRWRNIPTLRGTPVVDTIVARVVQPALGSQRRRVRGGT